MKPNKILKTPFHTSCASDILSDQQKNKAVPIKISNELEDLQEDCQLNQQCFDFHQTLMTEREDLRQKMSDFYLSNADQDMKLKDPDAQKQFFLIAANFIKEKFQDIDKITGQESYLSNQFQQKQVGQINEGNIEQEKIKRVYKRIIKNQDQSQQNHIKFNQPIINELETPKLQQKVIQLQEEKSLFLDKVYQQQVIKEQEKIMQERRRQYRVQNEIDQLEQRLRELKKENQDIQEQRKSIAGVQRIQSNELFNNDKI